MEIIFEIIGIIGAALVLIVFLLNQTDRLKNSDFYYDFGNFLGSLFLFVYAIYTGSIPFLVINLVWGLASLKDLLKR